MYKIYADNTLIYDSTVDDYKIGKGDISLEIGKAGSFVFSMYPDNPYYDKIVKMKTIIKVYRDSEMIFKGRALKAEDSFYKCRVVTCEGALNFLRDSIIRPYDFKGSPVTFFNNLISQHNAQVDVEKQFVVGQITVVDNNDYIARNNTSWDTTLSNIESRLLNDMIGGYIHITYNAAGQTVINYYDDFPARSSQSIEFGENLKDFTKTANAEDIATVIIPLGAKLKDAEGNDTEEYLTIKSVNGGKDYIEDSAAIAVYGRITKVIIFEDVNVASNLMTKGRAYLTEVINQNITIELNAVDLHLLDRSIESFRYGEYIPVVSAPHDLNVVMLCKKQTISLLKPDNDSITLGYTYSSFTETTVKSNKSTSSVNNQISSLIVSVTKTESTVTEINKKVDDTSSEIQVTTEDLAAVVKVCQDLNVSVSENTEDISQLQADVESISTAVTDATKTVTAMKETVDAVEKSNSAAVKTVNGMNDRVTSLEALGLFVGEDGNIYQEED